LEEEMEVEQALPEAIEMEEREVDREEVEAIAVIEIEAVEARVERAEMVEPEVRVVVIEERVELEAEPGVVDSIEEMVAKIDRMVIEVGEARIEEREEELVEAVEARDGGSGLEEEDSEVAEMERRREEELVVGVEGEAMAFVAVVDDVEMEVRAVARDMEGQDNQLAVGGEQEPEDIVFKEICGENVLVGVAGQNRTADRFLALHMRILCEYSIFFVYNHYDRFLLLASHLSPHAFEHKVC
jgi:hypothetical protein